MSGSSDLKSARFAFPRHHHESSNALDADKKLRILIFVMFAARIFERTSNQSYCRIRRMALIASPNRLVARDRYPRERGHRPVNSSR